MKQWLFPETEPQIFLLASLADRRGSLRLKAAVEAVGKIRAMDEAKCAGPYLLEDDLAHSLRLEGVWLPETGEITCLSPSKWRLDIVGLPENMKVRGIALDSSRQAALEKFLRGRKHPDSPEALVAIAEQFFFEDSIKVVLAYTEPRFQP